MSKQLRKALTEELRRRHGYKVMETKIKPVHIANALMKMNGGRGPDIIACGEVESVRAAEMLTGVLNGRIKEPEQKYK